MKFWNEMDIDYAMQCYGDRDDNVGSAVRILSALRDDVNANSDGWCHWPVPVRAARQLIQLIELSAPAPGRYTGATPTPIHATDLRKAIAPIKAFYTRAHRGDYGGPFPARNRWLEP